MKRELYSCAFYHAFRDESAMKQAKGFLTTVCFCSNKPFLHLADFLHTQGIAQQCQQENLEMSVVTKWYMGPLICMKCCSVMLPVT